MHTEAAHTVSTYTNASTVSDPIAAFCNNKRRERLKKMHIEAAHTASTYTNASTVSDHVAAFCSNKRKRGPGNQAAHEYIMPPSTNGSSATQFSSPAPDPVAAFCSNKRNKRRKRLTAMHIEAAHTASTCTNASAVSDHVAAFCSNKRKRGPGNQAAHEYIMPPSTNGSSAAQFSSPPPGVVSELCSSKETTNDVISSANQNVANANGSENRSSSDFIQNMHTKAAHTASTYTNASSVSDPVAAFCSNKGKRGPGNQAADEYIMPPSTNGSSTAQFSSPPPAISNCYAFKRCLREYAQKKGLGTPLYETINEGPYEPSFRSTVIVNDVRYDSLAGFSNQKASQHSAAEVALAELAKSDGVEYIVHETGLCKNLLQEYAQKMNYAIPLYQCQKDEKRGLATNFKCTVEIGGIQYIGASAKTKKEAKVKAARTALIAIQSSSLESLGNSQLTVIPFRKRGAESASASVEAVNVPKAKKDRCKQKMSKKKISKMKGTKNESKQAGKLDVIVEGLSRPESDQTCASSAVQAMGGNGLLPVSAGLVSELCSSNETTNDVISSVNQNVANANGSENRSSSDFIQNIDGMSTRVLS